MRSSSNSETGRQTKDALDQVCSALGVEVDENYFRQFINGRIPTFLFYEKLSNDFGNVPALQKMLVAVASYLAQEKQYYDIFRACKPVILIERLALAIPTLLAKVKDSRSKLDELSRVPEFDKFDSILFELLTAAAYAQADHVSDVRFAPSGGAGKTPDIVAKYENKEFSIECKHFNRNTDVSVELRNRVREMIQPVLNDLHKSDTSVVFDISFSSDPMAISQLSIRQEMENALAAGGRPIQCDFGQIIANGLSRQKHESYSLFPSPMYFKDRYNFATEHWQGVVVSMKCQHAVLAGNKDERGASSWLDDVSWEAAAKWRLDNEEVASRQRNITIKRIFEGLDQLKTDCAGAILHVAFECDKAIQVENQLRSHLKRLSTSQHRFSWILFHEKLFDVTYDGMFDLIEHVHFIPGTQFISPKPPVTGIYSDSLNLGVSAFGKRPRVDSPTSPQSRNSDKE